ncbi:hypothetical protein [Chitinophaga jiangningensis]|uniref:hypothetical protein n=1 Tax=Chitinophaga jiangningensis TaxID=1419482 RepID=UPI0015B637B4|nr:hypothetical protein [Chitinophaga jiangningensis]
MEQTLSIASRFDMGGRCLPAINQPSAPGGVGASPHHQESFDGRRPSAIEGFLTN